MAELSVGAAATATVADTPHLGREGTPVSTGTQRPGKKEGVWLGYLFAVTLAREPPRCQSPAGAGSLRPSDVATLS